MNRVSTEPRVGHAALELIRGRPLSVTSSEYAWASNQLHAIEQDISDAAHRLAELALAHDRPDEARWAAEKGLTADPYAEMLYRDLMLASAAAGNTSELPAILERLHRLLEVDDDANDADDILDPATTRLYHDLAATAAGSRPTGSRSN